MSIHSEGIYGARTWKIFGEGPGIVKTKSGVGMNGTPEHFNEKERNDLTGADIRFATKADALYVFAVGQSAPLICIGRSPHCADLSNAGSLARQLRPPGMEAS